MNQARQLVARKSEARQLAAARRDAATGRGRALRTQARLSLIEVAKDIGTSVATLSRWESNRCSPHGPAAVRWVELLDDLERDLAGMAPDAA